MYILDSYLDELIASDIPSGIDLTTHVLGIGGQPGPHGVLHARRGPALRDRGGRPASSAASAARWPKRFPAAPCLRPATCS